jgi:ectoine hydroxylase-related dioxygenase (phytanoyl-CoA dioxygenase family)
MNSQGFAIIANSFARDEMRALADSLERRPLLRSRAGARHLMRHPDVAALAMDSRLLAMARPVLGPGATPFRATLFDKSADANWLVAWHQDTALPLDKRFEVPGWSAWSEKYGVLYAHGPADALEQVLALRIHLDDSDDDNGPLRVISGSHIAGVMTDAQVLELAARNPSTTCEVKAGGVIAMRPLIVHASSKVRADRPRRVLHIEYATSLEIRPGVKLRLA